MDWKGTLGEATTNRQSLVIIGPSGCGKTTIARHIAPKPALFCTHVDTLRQFRPGYHKSIIFDDVNFTHIPREGQINIVEFEQPRAIHVRYGVVTIPAGVVKVFTANVLPISTNDPAIARRVKLYYIEQ